MTTTELHADTRRLVRETMATIAREACVSPRELLGMTAVEFVARRAAVRLAATRETVRP